MEGLTLEEFKVYQKNKHGGRGIGKIRNSYTIYDYFCNYKKTRPKEERYRLTHKQYSDIIHMMNRLLIDELFNSGYVDLPYRLGRLTLYKSEVKLKFVDGRLKIPYLINWNETHSLWYSDPEAYENKTKIYFENKSKYYITFKSDFGSYKNQTYYKLTTNRELKRRVARGAKENILDNFFTRK
jgi:hypothetical protein